MRRHRQREIFQSLKLLMDFLYDPFHVPLYTIIFSILEISGNIMKLFRLVIHYSDPYLKQEPLEYSDIRICGLIALHEYDANALCICQYDIIRLFE